MVKLGMAIILHDNMDATEQRKYTRLNAAGMDISISDKIGFSTGMLKDISRFGICITDLPRQLQPEDGYVTVIIIAKEKHFKLRLKPQWEKQEGLTMTAGAAIDNVPWDWTDLIMRLERQQNNPLAKSSPIAVRKKGLTKTLRRGVFVVKKASDRIH